MLRNILAGTTALALVIAFAAGASANPKNKFGNDNTAAATAMADARSEEHTSELQSLMRISYAVFCLKKKNQAECNNEFRRQQNLITTTTYNNIDIITTHYK